MGYLNVDPRMTAQEVRQLRYRERYKEMNPEWDDSMVVLCRLFDEIVSEKGRVLDVGCGRANIVIERFRPFIREAVGIDADPAATEGNVCLDRIVFGDVERLPFEDGAFDVVLMQWVIEHLGRPDAVFKECVRVLRPGGTLLLVTPYKYAAIITAKRVAGSQMTSWLLRLAYGREEKDVFETAYLANTPDELTRRLAAAGFEKHALIRNPDPSYFGLNDALFGIVSFLTRMRFPGFAATHLVGSFVKPE